MTDTWDIDLPETQRYDPDMSKREFLLTYLLCRAQGHVGGMEGREVLREANRCWALLNELAPRNETGEIADGLHNLKHREKLGFR